MEFLTLMPMADKFLANNETIHCYDEKERKQITDELWNRRVSLLKITGYTDLTRVDRIEDRLAIKSLFVLGRGGKNISKERKECQRKLLKYIVADETSLFLEGDRNYRSEKYQNEFVSDKRKADRKRNTKPYIESCIDAAVDFFSPPREPRRSKKECEVAEEIIRTIAYHVAIDGEKAENKRIGKSMRQWLFKESHRGIALQNREEYQKACEEYKIDFPLAPSRTKEKHLIKEMLQKMKKAGIDETPYWVISPLLLRKEPFLENYFDKYFSNETSKDDFAYSIIISLVFGYLSHEKHMTTAGWGIVPKIRRTISNAEAYEFKEFEKRLYTLTKLETGYLKKYESVLGEDHNFISFPFLVKKYVKESKDIVRFVNSYYENIGITLKYEKDNYNIIINRISSLIQWTINRINYNKDHNLLPIALLLMIKNAGRRITYDVNVEVDMASTSARFRNDIPRKTQRYYEILFLDSVCTFLQNNSNEYAHGKLIKISESDIFLNYNEYLMRQGWEIKSKQELDFWISRLQNKCEKLPLIGYQIKFLDYVSRCLPTHFEYLPYQILGPYNTRPNDFYSIFLEKRQEIDKSVNSIVLGYRNSKKVIDSYVKIWSDFEVTYAERRDNVSRDVTIPFPSRLFSYPKDKSFDKTDIDNEKFSKYCFYYKSILTEMIMQEALNRLARQKLIGLFSKVYCVSLKYALNDNISMTTQKNSGNPGDSPGLPD